MLRGSYFTGEAGTGAPEGAEAEEDEEEAELEARLRGRPCLGMRMPKRSRSGCFFPILPRTRSE